MNLKEFLARIARTEDLGFLLFVFLIFCGGVIVGGYITIYKIFLLFKSCN